MQTVIQLVTIQAGDQAIIINNKIVATFDPQFETDNLCDLVEKISLSLKVPFEVMEMATPLDSDWCWDDILELLTPSETEIDTVCLFHHSYLMSNSIIFADDQGDELCRLTSDSSDKTDTECVATIKQIFTSINNLPTFELMNEGKNPEGYTANAIRSGDSGIYNEISVCIFNKESKCIGDILIGLTQHGEPRVLVSKDGDCDGDKIAVYPLRKQENMISYNPV
jgi:hypothetical protein